MVTSAKVFIYAFWVYTTITLFVLLLLKLKTISYGNGLADSIIYIAYTLIWLLVIFLKWLSRYLKRNAKLILTTILTGVMMAMCFYYFLEDDFHILK